MAVTIQVQQGVIDDLLSPARLKHHPEVRRFLEYVASREAENADHIYLNHHSVIFAVALAVAGYVTLGYEGDGALKTCSLTESGKSLLASY